jgi:hypothetical protein
VTGGHCKWIAVAGLLLLAGLVAGVSVLAAGQPPVPDGWTVHTDPTGSCRVATPPGWLADRDFFLARESPSGRWVEERDGTAAGLGLWGIDTSDPAAVAAAPVGTRYQLRASLRRGDLLCSVWRIKPGADFTAAETSTMKLVAKSLQAVP